MSRQPQSGSQPAASRNGNGNGNGTGNGNGNGQRRRSGSRQNGARHAQKADIWREAEPLPELEKIAVSRDATALLRSLGEPPMNGAIEAGYTFGAVVERAAGIATALAFSAGLLADQPD